MPSLSHKMTFGEVQKHYELVKYTLRYAERVEGGLLGIRVWRVD